MCIINPSARGHVSSRSSLQMSSRRQSLRVARTIAPTSRLIFMLSVCNAHSILCINVRCLSSLLDLRSNSIKTTRFAARLLPSTRIDMSLRRSARVSTKSSTATLDPENVIKETSKPSSKRVAGTAQKRKSKAMAATSSPNTQTTKDAPFAVPELPVTPLRKRQRPSKESPEKPPPFTPTPSAVGLIAHGSEDDHPFETLAALKPRPAEPHVTNAPLSTPGGSRIVAYSSSPVKPEASSQASSQDKNASPTKKSKAKDAIPPDFGVQHPPTSTVDMLLKDACEFLCKVDPKLKGVVEKHHCKMFSPEGLKEVIDPFTALASGIIGQQVGNTLDHTLYTCFTSLFKYREEHQGIVMQVFVVLKTSFNLELSCRKAFNIS